MQNTIQKYIKIFKKLRIDRAHGIAPHKPILLLSVLQAFSNKIYDSEKIYITPELVALFSTNWNLLVTSNHDCKFALPFYHLTSDKFWQLVPKQGFENILQLKSSMRSFANLNAAIECAIVDYDLLLFMLDNNTNKILQQCLLEEYFPATKTNFSNSYLEQQKLFDDIEGKILNEDPGEYRKEIKKLIEHKNEEGVFLRSILFKREIIKLYNNTCCISGMKIDSMINVSMVDACHIIPFSESYDDTITNGISLCPNLHRAFDRGLIGIDLDYKVIISKVFRENNNNYNIRKFEGKQIILPFKEKFYPLMSNFEWHRRKIFN